MKKDEPIVPERDSKPRVVELSGLDRNPAGRAEEPPRLESSPAAPKEAVAEGKRLGIVVRVAP